MKLVDKLVEISGTQRSAKGDRVAKVLPPIIFFIFFPALLFLIPTMVLDRWLHFPPIPYPTLRIAGAALLIITGIIFLLWTIKAQRELGKGTPMPLMATRKLVIQKPYAYCRNPLAFGLLSLYFGISLLIASISSMIAVLIFAIIILSYIKFIEEKELEKRYGSEYVSYKALTPFLIPRRQKNDSA